MFEGISLPDFSTIQWFLVVIAAILIGASKTGISGAGMISIPVMATIFGGKMSTGIVLPMLSIADIFAVIYYNRHAQWKYVFKLLPWAVLGISLGIFVGDQISDTFFRQLIGIIVISSVGIMIWQDIKKKKLNVPDYWWFAALMGFSGGFATMIGNAAGGIMALYLLSMRLPKNSYIGTGAWFFFVINLFKIPFHIFIWKTISLESFFFDLTMIPALLIGAFLGIKIVQLIPEKAYRIFIIVVTLISAFFLF